jgi:ABC-type Fe3+-hydroxamate transport system substrate-binding protein
MTHTPADEFGLPDLDTIPKRVVSLVPSVTESLFDLNLGERLVGITDYCIYPADKLAAIPRVGGTKNPDVERILALSPDLVILNQEENRRQDAEALQAAGIPIWVTHPRTVADAFNLLWNIMDVFHETSMVARIRLIEYHYDWVRGISQQRDDAGQTVKVFCPIWLDPLMTFNADTYSHDLLHICGGWNVFAERERQFPLKADLGLTPPLAMDDPRRAGRDTRYPRVTWEEVVSAQPDVILLPNEPYAFTEAHIPLFKALDVPAAHHDRIYLVDGSLITWHGTRIAYALHEIPSLLYPAEMITQ